MLAALAVVLAAFSPPVTGAAQAAQSWGWSGTGQFGEVERGTTVARDFTLNKRVLDLGLRVSLKGSTAFKVAANDCNTLIGALSPTCTVKVAFTPSSCETQSARLQASASSLLVPRSDSIDLTGSEPLPSVHCPVVHVAATGSDDAGGGPSDPLASIDAALERAIELPGATILLAVGSYSGADGFVRLDERHSGTEIRGGFDPADWSVAETGRTTLTGSPQAVLADSATDVVLGDLTLAASAPATSGASVYGLRAIHGSTMTLRQVEVRTGNARAGDPGARGAQGAAGRSGQAGESAGDLGCGTGPVGGVGGDGPAYGGRGGDGRCGSGFDGTSGGATPSGPGGAAGFGGRDFGDRGGSGGNGFPGSIGSGGSGGVLRPGGAEWTGTAGGTGRTGELGSGGGGGGAGGGKAKTHAFSFAYLGGAGGGGGAGGAGGGGGTGGQPGGGSFGIYLYLSDVVLHGVVIDVGAGGPGGPGGPGGWGGPGGPGGPGGLGEDCEVCESGGGGGAGGSGGIGGNGGMGGPGGGGTGGPSVGIYLVGSTESHDGTTSITVGSPGPGGQTQPPGLTGSYGEAGMAREVN